MVDTISNTRGIGRSGTATSRYGAAPAAPHSAAAKQVAPAAATPGTGDNGKGGHDDHPQGERAPGLKLEIKEDEEAGELVYRFVDARTGDVVRQWDGDGLGKLRDYVRDKRIHLIDKTV